MPQKYYNTAEAAQQLGVSEEKVRDMLDKRELHGYRDGADWKFKAEDIDAMAKQRGPAADNVSDSGELGEVLLTDSSLGSFGSGSSGTVIGGKAQTPADEELSDLRLSDSDIGSTGPVMAGDTAVPSGSAAGKPSPLEELDMTLDEDLTLEDSQVGSAARGMAASATGDSAVALGGAASDDDLVLGSGSGTGSDITLGGDSGISLVDPSDSGISLEEPLQVGQGAEESLELGEDDLLSLAEASATGMKGDDDFLLTPAEEAADEEDSESGSQVIALETEGDESATMVAPSSQGMAAMLGDSAVGAASMPMAFGGAAVTPQSQAYSMGAPVGDLPPAEAPYSVGNIVTLSACALLLFVGLMFTYDLARNMWAWSGAYSVNSSMMDTILGWFGM